MTTNRASWIAFAASMAVWIGGGAVVIFGLVLVAPAFGIDPSSPPYEGWGFLAILLPTALAFYVDHRVRAHLKRKWKLPDPPCKC